MPRKPLCFYCARSLKRPKMIRGVCVCSAHIETAMSDSFSKL